MLPPRIREFVLRQGIVLYSHAPNVTYKVGCELIARFLNSVLADSLIEPITGHDIWTAHPDGELYYIPANYEAAFRWFCAMRALPKPGD